jgi:hypothetical protein
VAKKTIGDFIEKASRLYEQKRSAVLTTRSAPQPHVLESPTRLVETDCRNGLHGEILRNGSLKQRPHLWVSPDNSDPTIWFQRSTRLSCQSSALALYGHYQDTTKGPSQREMGHWCSYTDGGNSLEQICLECGNGTRQAMVGQRRRPYYLGFHSVTFGDQGVVRFPSKTHWAVKNALGPLYSASKCFSIRARTSAKASRVRMSGMVSGPRHGRDQSGRGKAQSYAILHLQSRRAVRSSGFFCAQ